MKELFLRSARLIEKLGTLLLSKGELAKRAVLRSEEREKAESEADRLDRLRNPQDYRGR